MPRLQLRATTHPVTWQYDIRVVYLRTGCAAGQASQACPATHRTAPPRCHPGSRCPTARRHMRREQGLPHTGEQHGAAGELQQPDALWCTCAACSRSSPLRGIPPKKSNPCTHAIRMLRTGHVLLSMQVDRNGSQACNSTGSCIELML
jgi:hypothetical protein